MTKYEEAGRGKSRSATLMTVLSMSFRRKDGTVTEEKKERKKVVNKGNRPRRRQAVGETWQRAYAA